jgi:hypothetical protein
VVVRGSEPSKVCRSRALLPKPPTSARVRAHARTAHASHALVVTRRVPPQLLPPLPQPPRPPLKFMSHCLVESGCHVLVAVVEQRDYPRVKQSKICKCRTFDQRVYQVRLNYSNVTIRAVVAGLCCWADLGRPPRPPRWGCGRAGRIPLLSRYEVIAHRSHGTVWDVMLGRGRKEGWLPVRTWACRFVSCLLGGRLDLAPDAAMPTHDQ